MLDNFHFVYNGMVRAVAIAALHLLQLLAIVPVLLSANISLPSCISKCGDVSIPYPFGVGAGCYRKGFKLTCNVTYDPPKLFLGYAGAEVLNISLRDGTLHIDSGITRLTGSSGYTMNWGVSLDDSIFTVSEFSNKFIVLGCGFQFLVRLPETEDTIVACASSCLHGHPVVATDGTCSGVGCCETSMPGARNSYTIELHPFSAGNYISKPGKPFNATVAVVEKRWWGSKGQLMLFQKAILGGFGTLGSIPNSSQPVGIEAAVKWKFMNLSCAEALGSSDFGCVSNNSYCLDKTSRSPGYLCHCRNGFEGNPYIPNGCQDIDECTQPDKYPCFTRCVNTIGSYDCTCPHGTSGNPEKLNGCMKDGTQFSGSAVATGVASISGFVLLIFAAILLRRKVRVRKDKRLRELFFKKNRGLLLQQLVDKDIAEKMIFSLEELEKATNKFNEARKVGNGGHGTVYKGILSDQRVVAIKKSKHAIESETDSFINEVAILSQVNHRNVVKLFGCCLETEVPLLVYEFISNGTLHDHIHVSSVLPLPWSERLRIILEISRSLAYLHSAASISIIHRDIKTANILLDDNLTAKVSDFGASRGIPIDQTRVTTVIQGTFGYLDPECYHTSRLTEKSDVYSFGVILVELLTRKKPHIYMSPTGNSLMAQFLLLRSQDKLCEILDPLVAKEGEEEAREVAEIAAMCLSSNGEHRPTMKQVEMRLEALRGGAATNVENSTGAEGQILNFPSVEVDNGKTSDSSNVSRQYSMEREMLSSLSFPR